MIKIIKFNLKTILFSVLVFFGTAFFTMAQTLNINPTIEVCVGGICYPEVTLGEVNVVVDADGLIPGNLTYKRGSLVRIHAEVKDPGGLKYVKAIVRDVAGIDLAIIPLYNDGDKLHGDQSGAVNGSPSGKDDDIFSNIWNVPYSLDVATPYYLHIEAADNFANVYESDIDATYNPDPYEIEFFLTDTCLSVCPNVGDERCNGSIIQECLFDAGEGCNSWQSASSCPTGVCCGVHPNIFCCGAGQSCSTVNTCINCDRACNGVCSNALCSGPDDPDCPGTGCCGDHACDAGETPTICPGDCPDVTGPTIILSPSTLASVDEGLILVFMATITDDYYGIATDPTITIKDSLGNPVGVTPLFDNGVDGGDINSDDHIFTGLINTFALGLTPGAYTVDATAEDTSPSFNSTTINNIHTFTVNCVSECNPFVFPGDCDSSDNLLSCVMGGDGCYDIGIDTNCPSLGGQVCRFNTGVSVFNCCNENCDPSTYIPTCDATGQYLQACVTQADGCDREQTNIDCQVQTASPNGACGVSPSTGNASCCVNACTLGQTRCNNTLNIVETCGIDQITGCNTWQSGDDCAATAATCHIGTGGANCCANACPTVGANLFCDAPGLWTQNCVYNAATDCNEKPNNTNCSLIPGQVCRINSSNTSNCCADSCNPSTYTPTCSGNILQDCVVQANGCYQEQNNINCATNGQVCKTNTNGDGNCCSNNCNLTDAPRCTGDSIEVCQTQSTGCNTWVEQTNCAVSLPGTTCHIGTGGANCCANACPAVGTDLFCDAPGLWTQNCVYNAATDCNEKPNNINCNSTGQVCRINSSNTSNCCADSCNPSTYTPTCSGNILQDCVVQANGCYQEQNNINCATNGQVCKTNTSGEGNCCANECNIGDPFQCNGNVIESCQTQTTGCNAWVGGTNCGDTGKICYDGAMPSDNAYCDILDTTPPVVTLLNPNSTNQSWFQDTQGDFESSGYVATQTSTTLSPGSVSLGVITSPQAITVTNNTSNIASPTQEGGWGYGTFSGTVQNGVAGSGASVKLVSSTSFKDGAAAHSVGMGYSVKVVDLDNDGDLDLLKNGGVYKNDGSGNFAGGSIGLYPYFTDAGGDLNGDGNLDVVNFSTMGLIFAPSIGPGTFGAVQTIDNIPGDDYYTRAVIADMNKDGVKDVVSLSFTEVKYYKNNGNGTFTLITTLGMIDSSNEELAIDDLDGDGDNDILIGGAQDLGWWENNGTGTAFIKHFLKNTGVNISFVIAIRDADGDGDKDIFSTGMHNTYLETWINDGSGNFTSINAISCAASKDISINDFDGDGDLDMLGGNYSSFYWCENNGSFLFTFHNIPRSELVDQTKRIADTVASGDFDGDGDIDVLRAYNGAGGNGVWYENDVLYQSSGTYIAYLDAGDSISRDWNSFYFSKTSTSGGVGTTQISIRVKSGNDSANPPSDLTTAGCLIDSGVVDGLIGNTNNLNATCAGTGRYLWYKATLTASADNSRSPILNQVIANADLGFYASNGTYTSAVYDTIANQNYGTINWNETLNGGAISMKARSCNNADCSDAAAWNGCPNLSKGSDITGGCVMDGKRYIQYQATLTQGANPALSPLLDNVAINFSQKPVFVIGDFVNIVVRITDASPLSVVNPPQIYIQYPDGTNITTLQVYDDGNHNDGAAGDSVYGTVNWDSAGHSAGAYYIDAFAEDNKGNNTAILNNIGGFTLQ